MKKIFCAKNAVKFVVVLLGLFIIYRLLIFNIIPYFMYYEPKDEYLVNLDSGFKHALDNGKMKELNKKILLGEYEVIVKYLYSDGIRCFLNVLVPLNKPMPTYWFDLEKNGIKKDPLNDFHEPDAYIGGRTDDYNDIHVYDYNFNDILSSKYSLVYYPNAIANEREPKLRTSLPQELFTTHTPIKEINVDKKFEELYIKKVSIADATIKIECNFTTKINNYYDNHTFKVKQNGKVIEGISNIGEDPMYSLIFPPEFDPTQKYDLIFYNNEKKDYNAVIQIN